VFRNYLIYFLQWTSAFLYGGICENFTAYFRVLSWYSRRPEELVFMSEVLLLLLLLLLLFNHHRRRRRRNVFCITTRYGLEVPGIECPWGRNFPYPSRPVSMSTQLPVNGCRFLGVKQLERGANHPLSSSVGLRMGWPSTSASTMPVQIRYGWPFAAPLLLYEGWNFNSGNYLFTTDTK